MLSGCLRYHSSDKTALCWLNEFNQILILLVSIHTTLHSPGERKSSSAVLRTVNALSFFFLLLDLESNWRGKSQGYINALVQICSGFHGNRSFTGWKCTANEEEDSRRRRVSQIRKESPVSVSRSLWFLASLKTDKLAKLLIFMIHNLPIFCWVVKDLQKQFRIQMEEDSECHPEEPQNKNLAI